MLIFLASLPSYGQIEQEGHHKEHAHGKHYLGLIAAGTLHGDKDLATLGIEYACFFQEVVGAGIALEILETGDILAAAFLIAKPGLGGLKLVLGPGVELKSGEHKEESHAAGKMYSEENDDTEVFLRTGAQYAFHIGRRFVISPLLELDVFAGKEDFIYGAFLGVNF